MKIYVQLQVIVLFALSVLNAQTLISITDTFEGENAGGGLYDDANTAATTTGGSSWVTDDGSQLPSFVDRGGGNIAIQIDKTGGTRENAIRIPSLTQGYFSFDFNFIQDGLQGSTTKDSFTLRLASDSALTTNHSSGFIDRSAQNIALGEWHNVKLFFNSGTEVFNYDTTGLTDSSGTGGLGTLDPSKLALFLDNDLISNSKNDDGATGPLNYAGFVIYKSLDQDLIIQFDNFEVNGIPEVANYALISGLVVFLLMFLIRMR